MSHVWSSPYAEFCPSAQNNRAAYLNGESAILGGNVYLSSRTKAREHATRSLSIAGLSWRVCGDDQSSSQRADMHALPQKLANWPYSVHVTVTVTVCQVVRNSGVLVSVKRLTETNDLNTFFCAVSLLTSNDDSMINVEAFTCPVTKGQTTRVMYYRFLR
ncbi:hypothetical protein Bbelb_415520 [Branchiostoma belcheri]|nr:hypothetical protein Bbelb_415520 [Branchiostoma belcheri]